MSSDDNMRTKHDDLDNNDATSFNLSFLLSIADIGNNKNNNCNISNKTCNSYSNDDSKATLHEPIGKSMESRNKLQYRQEIRSNVLSNDLSLLIFLSLILLQEYILVYKRYASNNLIYRLKSSTIPPLNFI